jgi:hypothetical protein
MQYVTSKDGTRLPYEQSGQGPAIVIVGGILGDYLQQGVSILDTVEQAGYFDQPHLTRSLKYLIGQTPAQIREKSRP